MTSNDPERRTDDAVTDPLLKSDQNVHCDRVSAQTATKIIHRIKALTCELLPIEVDADELQSPTCVVHS